MRDPEFIKLRNKFFIGVVVSLIFTVPLFLIFYNRLTPETSKVIKRIEGEDTFYLLVVEKNCKNCSSMKNILKDQNVDYEIIDKNKDKKYSDTLKLLDLSSQEVETPCLIYIEQGNLIASLPSIQEEEEIITFMNNHNGGLMQ